jgi:hypothetical protein
VPSLRAGIIFLVENDGKVVARGVDGIVTIEDGTVVIRHVGSDQVRRFIGGQRSVEDRVAIADLADVHLVPATFWWNGHLRLEMQGGNANTGDVHADQRSVARHAARDTNAVLFKRRHQPEFEALQKQILNLIEAED